MSNTLSLVYRHLSHPFAACVLLPLALAGCADAADGSDFEDPTALPAAVPEAGTSPTYASPGTNNTTPTSSFADAGSSVFPASSSGSSGSSSNATGNSATGSSSNSAGSTANKPDGGDLLSGLGGLLTPADGGTKPAPTDAGGASTAECKDQICIDVFDCYLFHPDKTACGFTACENFVCK